MSDKSSTRLLNEINNSICATNEAEEADLQPIGEIEILYEWVAGLREDAKLLWAYEEEHLYYVNSYSRNTKITACTCIVSSCRARVYVKEDGAAYRKSSVEHLSTHGSFYERYKRMYCFNKMKERAINAPASTTPFEIYSDAVLE